MKPTLGRIVHYLLTDADADAMNKRRDDYQKFANSHAHPHEPGTPEPTGHVAHFGNDLAGGEYYPAVVVRTNLTPDTVNLKVLLDGTDDLWVRLVHEGDEPGTWAWPPLSR